MTVPAGPAPDVSPPVGPEHLHGAAEAGPFFADLLKDYVPRQACMLYEPELVWLHAVADGLIALAYFTIPLALVYFVRRRRDLRFGWIFVLFAAFILLCGTTHLFSVVALWNAYYRLDGLVKLATGLVSAATAAALWSLIPRALAVPGPAQLRELNHELALEVEERRRAEADLRRLAGDLEARVAERTAELEAANEDLVREVEARRAAQAERDRLLDSERQARGEAERASGAMEAFIADLSHELRGPLHAIRGWVEILRQAAEEPLEPRRRTGLETIERNTAVLVRLLDDLLDVNRIVSGKLHLSMEPVRLSPVVEAAAETVEGAAAERGVDLVLDLAPDGGGKDGDAVGDRVEGDAARLQQVALNLLANAVKYSEPGGRVEVRLTPQGPGPSADGSPEAATDGEASPAEADGAAGRHGWIELSVRDEGRGIPPALLPHVFERYRQASPDDPARGGLGLGLSIVKHLVERHGGSVRAESAGEGQGATFTVRLPRL